MTYDDEFEPARGTTANTPAKMTRTEAITAVKNAFSAIAGEYAGSLREWKQIEDEAIPVLRALGCTEDEISSG